MRRPLLALPLATVLSATVYADLPSECRVAPTLDCLLAAEGAQFVAVARTVGGLEELDDAISAAGGSATLVP